MLVAHGSIAAPRQLDTIHVLSHPSRCSLSTRPDSPHWCTWLVCIFNIITFLTTCHKVYPHPLRTLMMRSRSTTTTTLLIPRRYPWLAGYDVRPSFPIFIRVHHSPPVTPARHFIYWMANCSVQLNYKSCSFSMVIMQTTLCSSTG